MTDQIQPTGHITINIGDENPTEEMMNDVILPGQVVVPLPTLKLRYTTRPKASLDNLTHADKQRCVSMLDYNARTDIETFCRTGETQREASGIVLWWDIGQIPACPEREIVQNAIWWCTLRGLFTRHTVHHHWVRFHSAAREQYETQANAPATETTIVDTDIVVMLGKLAHALIDANNKSVSTAVPHGQYDNVLTEYETCRKSITQDSSGAFHKRKKEGA